MYIHIMYIYICAACLPYACTDIFKLAGSISSKNNTSHHQLPALLEFLFTQNVTSQNHSWKNSTNIFWVWYIWWNISFCWCFRNPAITSWGLVVYPIISLYKRFLYISGGAGFQPSTVSFPWHVFVRNNPKNADNFPGIFCLLLKKSTIIRPQTINDSDNFPTENARNLQRWLRHTLLRAESGGSMFKKKHPEKRTGSN